jgi:hypothetical protein
MKTKSLNLVTVYVLSITILFVSSLTTASPANPDMDKDKSGSKVDPRLKACRTLNDKMELRSFKTKAEWEEYRAWLKTHILVSTGLYPLPPKTPVNAKVFDTIKHEDYAVSKVHFESRPGFFVCGNLYKPVGKKGPFPGILCPHGHWSKGRFGETKDGSVRARMISFARQGYIAFSWSMVGYNKADQIKHRGDVSNLPWNINLMGLQLWNSIRSCDWLASLPDVDPDRIGCTGASGGGTQTFMLMAIDDRIKVAAPVNMISAIMQGGCECENAPLLRLEANNVEIASTMAPRPLLMVSATGDWTKNTLELEHPAVREVYKLYNAEDKLHTVRIDAPHNYNLDSRNAVYPFFAKHLLKADKPDEFKEQKLEIDPVEKLVAFDDDHPRPDRALNADTLRAYLIQEAQQIIVTHRPTDAVSLTRFRELYRPAYEHTLNASPPRPDQLESQSLTDPDSGPKISIFRYSLRRRNAPEMIPLVLLEQEVIANMRNKPISLIVHPRGQSALFDADTQNPIPLVKQLLKNGYRVASIDCFRTGRFAPHSEKDKRPTTNHNWTYNRTDLAWRAQDILTAIAFCKTKSDQVNLIGLERAGLWSLLARPLTDGLHKTIVDVDQFDPQVDAHWQGDLLIPGLRRIDGFQTAAILTAPGALMIHNTGETFPADEIKSVYRLEKSAKKLRVRQKQLKPRAILNFLSD